MVSRKRTKLLKARKDNARRVANELETGDRTIDRNTLSPYEDGWVEAIRPPKPLYTVPPPETRLLAAGTFLRDTPTMEQRRRGLPHHLWRAAGSPVQIRWEPQSLETETWRYVDIKGETVAQSDVDLNGKTVHQLHADVQFKARSAIAIADRQYARELTIYRMRMELYRAAGNHGDNDDPGNPRGFPGLGQQDDEDDDDDDDDGDGEPYGRQDDGLYDEWLGQLREEGVDERMVA
jgi:hypothetical protein